MKQILILRILGIILVVVLIVNFTIVMAAPFYMTPATQVTAQSVTAASGIERDLTGEVAEDDVDGIDDDDPAEDDSLAAQAVDIDTIAAQPVDIDVLGDPTEENVSVDRFEAADLNLDRLDTEFADTATGGDVIEDPAGVVVIDPDLLFAIGERIGQLKSEPAITHHVANAAKQLMRWQTRAVSTHRSNRGLDDLADGAPPANATFESSEPSSSMQIVLRNPTNYPVVFELGGRVLNLQPGAEHVDASDDKLLIRFDRGGDLGEQRMHLMPGVYEFSVSRDGWEVKEPTDTILR